MYVTPGTTLKEIEHEIKRIEEDLTWPNLPDEVREALHEELDYLRSFLPKEVG